MRPLRLCYREQYVLYISRGLRLDVFGCVNAFKIVSATTFKVLSSFVEKIWFFWVSLYLKQRNHYFVGCCSTWYNNIIQKYQTVYLLRFDKVLNSWHYIYFGSSCMTLKCYPLNCQGSCHTPLVYRRQFIKEAFLIACI